MIVVKYNEKVDLGDSLIRTSFEDNRGLVDVAGAIALDSTFQVLPLVSGFLTSCLNSLFRSVHTVKLYGLNILYALEYLKSRVEFRSMKADEVFLVVQKHVIKEYYVHLLKEGLSSVTIRNRDTTLHSFFTDFLCYSDGANPALRVDNPFSSGYLSPPPKSRLVQSCPIEDLKELMLVSPHEGERTLLQFMYDSGIRRSEVGRITIKDVDEALDYDRNQLLTDEPHLTFSPEYAPFFIPGSKGSGNEIKPRYTLVSKCTLQRIKRLHATPQFKKIQKRTSAASMPAFLNSHGGGYTAGSVSKLLERLSGRAMKVKSIKRSYYPHTLRHGFAYSVLQSLDHGVDLNDRYVMLQKYLGHNHQSTTDVYTRIPHDLFKAAPGQIYRSLTRAQKMEMLVKLTREKGM